MVRLPLLDGGVRGRPPGPWSPWMLAYAQVPETSETQSRDKFLLARVRSARVFAQIADIKLEDAFELLAFARRPKKPT